VNNLMLSLDEAMRAADNCDYSSAMNALSISINFIETRDDAASYLEAYLYCLSDYLGISKISMDSYMDNIHANLMAKSFDGFGRSSESFWRNLMKVIVFSFDAD